MAKKVLVSLTKVSDTNYNGYIVIYGSNYSYEVFIKKMNEKISLKDYYKKFFSFSLKNEEGKEIFIDKKLFVFLVNTIVDSVMDHCGVQTTKAKTTASVTKGNGKTTEYIYLYSVVKEKVPEPFLLQR